MSKFDVTKNYKPCDLTENQAKEWANTRVYFTAKCPGFSHIFYTMLNNNDGKHFAFFTKDIQTLATDSVNILINPDFFFSFTIKERVFALAHEVLHAVLDHINHMYKLSKLGHVPYSDGVRLPYIPELANISQDYCINAMLVSAKVGSINSNWLYDRTIATEKSLWTDVYRSLYEALERSGCIIAPQGIVAGSGKLRNNGWPIIRGNRFDENLDPGKTTGEAPEKVASKRDNSVWNSAVAAAVAVEQARGDGTSPITEMFNAIITPKVTWQDYIRGWFARKTGSDGYNYRRLDRRLIVQDFYFPERAGYGVDLVVVAIDHSSSISTKQIGSFFGELSNIFDSVNPRRVIVIWCDTVISRVDDLEDAGELVGLEKYACPRGGTDFRPVFKWVSENDVRPDALVYLTDGDGCFPSSQPDYPVIWGSISKTSYPWGDVVAIDDLK